MEDIDLYELYKELMETLDCLCKKRNKRKIAKVV